MRVMRVFLSWWMLGASLLLAQNSYGATILVMGDSLSAGYGLPKDTGWVDLLARKAGARHTVINASVSGETSAGGVARLPQALAKHQPDIVLLELGANDALRGLPLQATQNNLQRMIEQIAQAGAKTVLIGIQIPPNYGRQYQQKFSQMYQELASLEKVPFVPFLLAKVANRKDLFQPDGLHPVAKAQPLLLDTVWPVLRPVLKTVKEK